MIGSRFMGNNSLVATTAPDKGWVIFVRFAGNKVARKLPDERAP